MSRLIGLLTLVLVPVKLLSADQISLLEKQRLVEQTIVAFYSHLLGDHPPSQCPPILADVELFLSEMPPEVRASLGEADATAAVWKYLRMHREAIAPSGLQPPYASLRGRIRYVSLELGPPKDPQHISVEVIGGAGNMLTDTTGVRKVVGLGLSWSDASHQYLVSPISIWVNGINALDPRGQFERPKDLWQLLGIGRLTNAKR